MNFKIALLFLAGMIVIQHPQAQKKHALIFAIGNYPASGGWQVISGMRDVAYIKTTLLKQGFLENDIKTVTDADVTVQGISNALTDLTGKVSPGDIAVIHFSTHGEQVEDDNNDETDGKDETIVTFNAVIPRLSTDFNKDQAEYFRDDRFGDLILRLRNKLGKQGDVVVFMDMCHSGSGSRGLAKIRGGQPPLVSRAFSKKPQPPQDTQGLFREDNTSEEAQSLATYVVISAARAEELNYETKDDNQEVMGSLTYAYSKVFETLDQGITYRSLFAKIQSVMHLKTPGQHPVLEGNGLDRALFGGRFIQQKPYFEIEKIKGTQMVIKAGRLSGLDSGAKLVVFPAGTNDPSGGSPLATGTIISAGSFSSTVKLDKNPRIIQAAAGWAFLTEPVYKIDPVNIAFSLNKTRQQGTAYSETELAAIKNALKSLPLVRFDGTPDLLIVQGVPEDSILIASNGHLFKTMADVGTHTEELKLEIQRYTQYKFLQGLEIKHPTIRIEIKIFPVRNTKAGPGHLNIHLVDGSYEFREGDTLAIWVKNPGTEPVYFNVIDLQPDGIINPVLPMKEYNFYPHDLRIEPGASRVFYGNFDIKPPYGTEILKVFVSNKEIDMEGITSTRGATTRGNFTVLEKLVKNVFDLSVRGISPVRTGNADGSAFNVLFTIKPR